MYGHHMCEDKTLAMAGHFEQYVHFKNEKQPRKLNMRDCNHIFQGVANISNVKWLIRVWVVASHGLYGMYKMTFSTVSVLQIRSGWMERWRGGAKGKTREQEKSSERASTATWLEFIFCVEKECRGRAGQNTARERGRVLLPITVV